MSYQQNHPLATSPTDIGQESLRSRPELELMWQRMTIIGESTRKLREVLSATGEMPLPYSTIADRAAHNMPAADNPYVASVSSSSAGVGDASTVEQQYGPDPNVAFGALADGLESANVAYLQGLQKSEEVAALGETGQKPALPSEDGTDETAELLARIQRIHDGANDQNGGDRRLAA